MYIIICKHHEVYFEHWFIDNLLVIHLVCEKNYLCWWTDIDGNYIWYNSYYGHCGMWTACSNFSPLLQHITPISVGSSSPSFLAIANQWKGSSGRSCRLLLGWITINRPVPCCSPSICFLLVYTHYHPHKCLQLLSQLPGHSQSMERKLGEELQAAGGVNHYK